MSQIIYCEGKRSGHGFVANPKVLAQALASTKAKAIKIADSYVPTKLVRDYVHELTGGAYAYLRVKPMGKKLGISTPWNNSRTGNAYPGRYEATFIPVSQPPPSLTALLRIGSPSFTPNLDGKALYNALSCALAFAGKGYAGESIIAITDGSIIAGDGFRLARMPFNWSGEPFSLDYDTALELKGAVKDCGEISLTVTVNPGKGKASPYYGLKLDTAKGSYILTASPPNQRLQAQWDANQVKSDVSFKVYAKEIIKQWPKKLDTQVERIVRLQAQENELVLTFTNDYEGGERLMAFPALNAGEYDFQLQAHYLLDMLKALDTEYPVFTIGDKAIQGKGDKVEILTALWPKK